MRYLGGKSRIAKEIAAIVAPKGFWWEPFCGGLSVSVQLAKYGPGLVSDVNPALISLYQAVRDGWIPPTSVSLEEWKAAKSLPDDNPMKAFAGVGCSFRGMWFQGYDKGGKILNKAKATGDRWITIDRPRGTREALERDVPKLQNCVLRALSFLDVCPNITPNPECIYADPPYTGTTGYKGAPLFDHGKFWAYCQTWASRGTRVFVSELVCPVPHSVVWSKPHTHRVGGTNKEPVTENLFRVL
jgi:DNA adenine methylase